MKIYHLEKPIIIRRLNGNRKNTSTPIDGTIEQEPEIDDISITIENPESVAVETEDGGMIIDFDPRCKNKAPSSFDSNLADFMADDELDKLGSELINAY